MQPIFIIFWTLFASSLFVALYFFGRVVYALTQRIRMTPQSGRAMLWLGSDLSGGKQAACYLSLLYLFVGIVHHAKAYGTSNRFFFLMLLPIAISLPAMSTLIRHQIFLCERGITVGLTFTPWERIDSYLWYDVEKQKVRLDVIDPKEGKSAITLRTSVKKRDRLTTLLEQHLPGKML